MRLFDREATSTRRHLSPTLKRAGDERGSLPLNLDGLKGPALCRGARRDRPLPPRIVRWAAVPFAACRPTQSYEFGERGDIKAAKRFRVAGADLCDPLRVAQQSPADRDQIELVALQALDQPIQPD